MRPPRCRQASYRRTAKRQEAQEHLGTATTLYGKMDMPYWLEQAEARELA
jgi:hypothetical protein